VREKKMAAKKEPESCDTCGERIGYYDPSLPEGEKVVVTRDCECVRTDNMVRREMTERNRP
jgi:hypothetical protein